MQYHTQIQTTHSSPALEKITLLAYSHPNISEAMLINTILYMKNEITSSLSCLASSLVTPSATILYIKMSEKHSRIRNRDFFGAPIDLPQSVCERRVCNFTFRENGAEIDNWLYRGWKRKEWALSGLKVNTSVPVGAHT